MAILRLRREIWDTALLFATVDGEGEVDADPAEVLIVDVLFEPSPVVDEALNAAVVVVSKSVTMDVDEAEKEEALVVDGKTTGV